MDCKIGEAIKLGKLDEHVQMSVDAADNLMISKNVDDDTRKLVKHCIESHHGTDSFQSKEAEIVMNADCYRFLLPKNVITYFNLVMSRGKSIEDAAAQVDAKVEEKWGLLSLPECKEELEENYKIIKAMISKI